MKHVAPYIPLDMDLTKESGLDIDAELTLAYADEYKEQIKDYDLEQLFKEISELRIDYDRSGALGIRIIKILVEAIDAWVHRN